MLNSSSFPGMSGSKTMPLQPSPTPEKQSDERSLNEKNKRILMMGIEVLAHREKEREGLEVYISEGRQTQSLFSQIMNVIRWILWITTILLNFADPIVTLVYGIINYASSISIVWLSAIAILAFIVFAVSISIPLSTVMLIANIILRIITYHQRYGKPAFIVSRIFSLLSFIGLGVIVVYELFDEARNSCK